MKKKGSDSSITMTQITTTKWKNSPSWWMMLLEVGD